jgi:hypothetical protein
MASMADLKTYRVFYTFYGSDRSVVAAEAIPMNEADIYSELLGSLADDGDFIGLIDDRGTTLQVMYEADDDAYWVEVPSPQRGGSYGARLSFDALVDLFKALPGEFGPESLPLFQFRSWQATSG